VGKSLEPFALGPVGLVHTQKIEAQSEKPTWTKALEFTQFACPCGTDPRLLSRRAGCNFSLAAQRRTSERRKKSGLGAECTKTA
jgi:hypothetical protein